MMKNTFRKILKIFLCFITVGVIVATVYPSFGNYKSAAGRALNTMKSAISYASDMLDSGKEMLNSYDKAISNFTSTVDKNTKSNFPLASQLDDLYAITQKLLNKQKYNYSTVAQDGYMIVTTPAITEEEVMINVNGVLTLTEVAESVGADVFAVQSPMRYIVGETQLPPSIEDFSHQNADAYLAGLKQNGFTNILDLREDKETYNSQDIYYATDHHWKVETALLAAEDVVLKINETLGYDLDPETVNPDNYLYELWKYKMKGSWARRTNPHFIEAEDFTIVKPNFETDVTLLQFDPEGKLISERSGAFEDSIIFEEGFPTEKYIKDYADLGYYAYLNATYTSYIKNHNATNDKKVLIYGDSSCRALGSFLCMAFSETLIVDTDPERYDISLDKTILEYEPDLVIFLSTVELDITERFIIQRGADAAE